MAIKLLQYNTETDECKVLRTISEGDFTDILTEDKVLETVKNHFKITEFRRGRADEANASARIVASVLLRDLFGFTNKTIASMLNYGGRSGNVITRNWQLIRVDKDVRYWKHYQILKSMFDGK